MEALFTLTLPARRIISRDNSPERDPAFQLHAIAYAAFESYSTPGAMIIAQSVERHNYCMELYLYDVDRRFTLNTIMNKPGIIFCYALNGEVRNLYRSRMEVPDLRARHYAGYCLPEGQYTIQLARGTHAFFYFAFEVNYLVSIIRHLPNLSALILPLLSPSFTFQTLPICRIDFGIRKIIKQMQVCSDVGYALDLSLLGFTWDLLSIYEDHLQAGKYFTNKTPTQIAREVYEYIRQHFTEIDNNQVSEIAGRFYIAEKTLSRAFKNAFGTTIHQLIIRLRMEHALYLLTESSSLIKDIAAETGYPDIYSFSRAFKKYHGYNPTDVTRR